MYLPTLEVCILKYMCLSCKFSFSSWATKIKVKLDLLTDMDMLLMVEKCIRGEISNFIYRYAKVNNKYIKDYDKNKELSYFWDVNNLCG